jgi:DNA primase catalytic core
MPDLREFCKTLDANIDIIALAAFLGLKLNRNSMAACIKHRPDKKPSMLFKNDHVYCFSCGYYARAIKFTMDYQGLDFKEALNLVCDFQGVPRFQFGQQSQAEIDAYQKKQDREDRFHNLMAEVVKIYQANSHPYLLDRGISPQIIQDFQIGATNGHKSFLKDELLKRGLKQEEFAPLLLNQYGQDFFQDCVIIPIFKAGACIGLYGRKYDQSQEFKHLYLKTSGFQELELDQETTLYNWDNARKFNEVYIFESIIDTLSAISAGIPNSVGIYGTQGLKKDHLRQLEATRMQNVWLVMDGDQPGRKAAVKHGYTLEDIGLSVNILLLPDGQDPNEYFLAGKTKESLLALPHFTPLQLAMKETNHQATGKEFVAAISPLLDRIVGQDPLSWNNALKLLKEHFSAENPSINDLKSALKKRMDDKEIEEKQEKNLIPLLPARLGSQSLADIFNDPTLADLALPPDYQLSEKGISAIVVKGEQWYELPIAHAPCIISHMASNTEIGTEFRELKFKQNGKVKSINVPREIICDQKKIIELSALDFPVNSLNAKYLVKYLAEFEAVNRAHLPKKSILHGLGHRYDSRGNMIFYLPQKTYGTDDLVTFEGKGPGDFEFFQALKPKGSLEHWTAIIQKYCLSHNFVMFNLFAGFSVPLFPLLNIHKSFIINFSRRTSSGKTTTNELAASIYGNPAKLILQWQFVTHVGIEQLADLFNGIPIFLDDAHNADPNKVSEIIYIITHGLGKARGHRTGGLQRTLGWITELFSTSERVLQENIKKEGAEARTWDFDVPPFDTEEDKEVAEAIRTIKKAVGENYGQAIVPFMDRFYQLGEAAWKIRYNKAYKLFNSKISKGGKTHRQIEYWAIVLMAGMIAEEVFHFGSDPIEACMKVFEFYQQEGFSDPIREAMDDYISWANSNDFRYDLSGAAYLDEERQYGERHGVKSPGEYIAVFPHLLKDFLVKQGYSYKAIIKGWRDKGWIETGKDERHLTSTISFRGKNARMIKICWKIYSQNY